ncbi:MAG: protein kinase [Acidobacteria bacterium]|nr:protein kinase [Acidobacteriota bacterium]
MEYTNKDRDVLRQIKRLLAVAMARPEGEQAAFVARQEGVSEEVRQGVLRLLEAQHALPAPLEAGTLAAVLQGERHEETPKVGEMLGERYRVERMLAAGGSSQVVEAADLRLAGARVAIKILRGGQTGVAAVRERLWREIQAIAQVSHPGVCGLVDEGVWRERYPYVVQQFRAGESLRERLAAGRLAAATALAIFRQLADVLQTCHEAGVLHLDLKPENILVHEGGSAEPRVTVVDFGIAQAVGGVPEEVSLGTGGYRAPEQLEGRAHVGSDVYALARIAGELFPAAPGGVRREIEKGLAMDPAERPESVRCFREGVERGLRRQRWGRLAVGAGLATLVVGVIWWNTGGAPRKPAVVRVLTQLKGMEYSPEFSPDGKLLYFSHGVFQAGNRNLYVLDLASGQTRALTAGDSKDERPVVSPDGQWLVFLRRKWNGPQTLLQMPAAGGTPRLVHAGEVQSYAFSGDGQHLILSEAAISGGAHTLRTLALATGKWEIFPAPPGFIDDIDVVLSRDGRQLAFCRYQTPEKGDVYVTAVSPEGRPEGEIRRVTRLERRVFHPSWYADGDGLVFTAGTLTRRGLWKLRMGREPEAIPEFAEAVEEGVVRVKGSGLVVVRNREDCDIWRFRRGVAGEYTGERLASTTALDEEPRYSADGRRVAFLSERSGALQAWVSGADGTNPVQVSRFDRAEKAWLTWGPAAVLSVFAQQPEQGAALFQADGTGGSAVTAKLRVPQGARLVGVGKDGTATYISFPRENSPLLERWPLSGEGRREAVAAVEAAFVRETDDGEWIYFTKRNERNGIYRLRRGGGAVEQVVGSLSHRTTFTLRNGWVYYASPVPRPGVYRQRMSDGKNEFLFALDKPPGWGMDVSLDERDVLIPQYEFDDADLVMVEGLP